MKTPQYKKGDEVFFVNKPMYLTDKPDTSAIVHHSFIGQDDEEYVVVESCSGGHEKYRMLPFGAIWDDMKGESNMQKKLKDPKEVLKIAIRAGIYNEDGTLTPHYSDDPNAYWLRDGVKYYDDDEQ